MDLRGRLSDALGAAAAATLGVASLLTGCSEIEDPGRFDEGPPRQITQTVDITEGTELVAALSPDGRRAALIILGQPWVLDLVTSLAELGSAVMKVRIRDPALDRLVVEVAHEKGLPVTSHYVFPHTVAYGLEGKEHTGLTYRGATSRYRGDVLDLLAAGGTCVTSTLAGGLRARILLSGSDPDLAFPEGTGESLEPFFPPSALEWLRRPVPPGQVQALGGRLRMDMANVARMVEWGIPVAAATDTGPLDPRLDLEVVLLVEAGLTPLQAIRAATLDPARCLGVDHELGTVAEGKRADLLLVRGDPSEDISRLSENEFVILGGRLYPRAELLPEEYR